MKDDQLKSNWISIQKEFLNEAQDLNQYFLDILKKENWLEDDYQEMLRILHSLKGGALSMNLTLLSDFTHHLESFFLSLIKKNSFNRQKDLFTFLEETYFFIEKLCVYYHEFIEKGDEVLEQSKLLEIEKRELIEKFLSFENSKKSSESDKASLSKSFDKKKEDTEDHRVYSTRNTQLKIDPEMLIQMHEHLSSIFLLRNQLKKIFSNYSLFFNEIQKKMIPKKKLKDFFLKENWTLKKQSLYNQFYSFDKDFYQMIQKMYHDLYKIQMIQVKQISPLFTQLYYQLSKKLNKKINFKILGENLFFEKWIIDAFLDPIIQILKNAMDHGIESPEERKEKKKPETASIILRFKRNLYTIVIEIEDDGKGIDINRLIEIAKEKKINIPKNKKKILYLIFESGFSTKKESSSISGRGIGLDIVKKKIESLKGNILVQSSKDKGSFFKIEIPIQFVMLDFLLFKDQNFYYGIPLEKISQLIFVSFKNFFWNKQKKQFEIIWKSKSIPIIFLSKKDSFIKKDKTLLLLCYSKNNLLAIKIDQILREEKILTHNIPFKKGTKAFSFVGLLKNGEICFIIDIDHINEKSNQ